MELELKYTKAMPEMNLLKSFIEQRFAVKLMDKNRRRDTVDARMIFARILRENGHTFSNIGKYLKKDHSTIIYYSDICMDIIKNDARLMNIYIECKAKFEENVAPMTYFSRDDMTKEIISLRNEIDKLILENNKLKDNDFSRLTDIINLIDRRTPVGHENLIKRKINEFFNGLWGD